MNQAKIDITSDLEKVSHKVRQLQGRPLSTEDASRLAMYEEIQAELKGRLKRMEQEEKR